MSELDKDMLNQDSAIALESNQIAFEDAASMPQALTK